MLYDQDAEVDEEPYIQLFDRTLLPQATRVEIEIYPAPDRKYLASWTISIPTDGDGIVDQEEVEALMDACFAAGTQLERLSDMIDDEPDDLEDES